MTIEPNAIVEQVKHDESIADFYDNVAQSPVIDTSTPDGDHAPSPSRGSSIDLDTNGHPTILSSGRVRHGSICFPDLPAFGAADLKIDNRKVDMQRAARSSRNFDPLV